MRWPWHRNVKLAAEPKRVGPGPQAYPYERYSPFWIGEDYALTTIDDLVSRKGLAVYREMMNRDDQVAACIRLVQFARLATGYDISPASDDEGLDQEICDFVKLTLGDLRESSINSTLLWAMDALPIGFSLLEKIWGEPYQSGDFVGKRPYRTFRPIPQETITIKRDAFGDIEPDGIWQAKEDRHYVASSQAPADFTKMPRERFVLWSWLSQWGSPFGISMLRPAYRWYMIKDILVRSWGKHVERFGFPHMDLEVPDETSDADMVALEEKLRNYMTGGILVHRASHRLTITPAGAQSTPTYQGLMSECNRGIARCCFMPSTLFDQQDTGTYGMADAQRSSSWNAMLDSLGDALADRVVMEQIIRPLVEHNYGPEVDIPKFNFKPVSQPDLVRLVTAATMLSDRGFPVGHKWVEQNAGIPSAGPGERALGPSVASGPMDQLPPDIAANGEAMDDVQREVMEAIAVPGGNGIPKMFGLGNVKRESWYR